MIRDGPSFVLRMNFDRHVLGIFLTAITQVSGLSNWFVVVTLEPKYSHLSNKRGAWNKRGGVPKMENHQMWRG